MFRPPWWGTLLALLFTGVFTALSLWQVDRWREKEALQADMERLVAAAPVTLDGSEDLAPLRFARVRATGRYEPEREVLLDNMVHAGRAGYHVFTPFHIEGSDTRVLVNRGWIPLGRSRAQVPAVSTPTDRRELLGEVRRPPSRPLGLRNVLQPNSDDGKVWLYLEPEYLAAVAGYPVASMVVLLDPAEADGFVRQWPEFDAKVGMHIGYAIHWAAFALATVVVYVVMNLRKKTGPKETESTS